MALFAVFFVAFFVIRFLLLSYLYPEKKKGGQEVSNPGQLAEIDGGIAKINGKTWVGWSVFEHIERGLKRNPDGPAVISMFQQSDCLDYLLSADQENKSIISPHRPNTRSTSHGLPNGFHREDGSSPIKPIHSPGKQPGADGPEDKKGSTKGSRTESDCLVLSYSQLHSAALKLAAGLIANGAQPYSNILMFIPNGGEYTVLLWACILLRITYVSLDPILLESSGSLALKQTLRTLKPQLIVVNDASSSSALDVAVAELQLAQPIRLSILPSRTAGWKSFVDVVFDATNYPIDEASLIATARNDNARRIHSIMFTSGTSGNPKGCPMSIANMSHVLHSQSWLVDSRAGAFALQQPHNSRGIAPAQTLQTWRAGGAVVMSGQNFHVGAVTEAIRRFQVTFIVLTPPMVHELAAELASKRLDVSCVKRTQVGGDAVTRGVLSRCANLFPQAQVCVNHGMTEGGGSFLWPYLEKPVKDISFFGETCPIGTVAPGAMIRIWDTEKMRVAKKGELGELHISSDSIIQHYLESRSEESFYEDGKGRWFRTGDWAMVNSSGLVYILGRKKDMIRRAGVGIMPAAIESSLEAFTGKQVRKVRFDC